MLGIIKIQKNDLSYISDSNINGTATLENSLAVFQKTNILIIRLSKQTSMYMPQRNEKLCPHNNLHMNVQLIHTWENGWLPR